MREGPAVIIHEAQVRHPWPFNICQRELVSVRVLFYSS